MKMTIDEAIKICEEDAEKIGGNPQSDRHVELCRQLAEWLTELKEAKRLLKSAIDEWHIICEYGECGEHCCWYENGKCEQEWSGKAEALKLIGEDKEE